MQLDHLVQLQVAGGVSHSRHQPPVQILVPLDKALGRATKIGVWPAQGVQQEGLSECFRRDYEATGLLHQATLAALVFLRASWLRAALGIAAYDASFR